MADVTSHYGRLRDAVYAAGVGKEELKALPSLPSRAQMIAAFQAMENDMLAAIPGIKADVDAALGVTTSPELFRKLFASYLKLRISGVI